MKAKRKRRRTASGKQERIYLWGKGISMTKSGHLRYYSPPELRYQYVHRHVIELLIEETPEARRKLIPWPYEVHHMDYVKTNNSPSNLLLLSESLHSYLTAQGMRDRDGRFRRKFHPDWRPAPQWVLFRDEDVDEIPF